MKRLIWILALALILSALAVTAFASEKPTFVVSEPSVGAGETAAVTVSLKNNPGIASMRLQLTFDRELTLTGIAYNGEIGGMSQQPQTLASPATLLWINGTANSIGDFTLATLTFEVAENAATGKKPITLTYDPDDVYDLAEKNLDFAIQNGGVTVRGDGSSTSSSTSSASATQTAQPVTYTDVAPTAWYRDAVSYVQQKGLMSGTGDNTFAPESTMTRAMLMTVLARYAGTDTGGGATWYEKGMSWAKANGVSDGTNPSGSITREQLVTMLYRYQKSPAVSGELSFSDAGSVSAWASDAMRWAVAKGIVTGMNDGTLAPQQTATRAQVATILMRFCECDNR